MARRYRIPLPPPLKKNYAVTINSTNFQVEPEKLPYSRHGLPGSILDIVSPEHEDMIDHACGGVQACSTCHIYVEKGFDNCNEISDREEDYLEKAPGVKLNSRLACCCVPNGEEDVIIQIPKWNKNEVRE